MCYPIISGIIATVLILIECYEDKFSDNEILCYSLFWLLIIVLLPIFYIIKIVKQSIKLKENNKLKEDKRKKELVNTVLKELKLR
jgi:hypothetical protein